jgi:hypothetical protein
LFVGNSYTYVNNLPGMFAQLAQSGGRQVFVDSVAPGGWTLAQHAASGQTLNKIADGRWNFVVLQEQSIVPAVEPSRTRDMYPAVRLLNDKIQNAGARTVLYMTWGRRDGLAQFGFQNYSDMQEQLIQGYSGIAEELGALLAPVGEAWRREPTPDLWQGDGSHPSLKGTYLAACVFYAAIFQQSPEGLAFTAGLPEETARRLQALAALTMKERLPHGS